MTDPLADLATQMVQAGIINLGTNETKLAAILHDSFTSLYLTASSAGAAAERERALRIVHSLVDNAAGDTTLGQTILKKIEGK